jgi:hypothetical protein
MVLVGRLRVWKTSSQYLGVSSSLEGMTSALPLAVACAEGAGGVRGLACHAAAVATAGGVSFTWPLCVCALRMSLGPWPVPRTMLAPCAAMLTA